jgi:hypothetical protein
MKAMSSMAQERVRLRLILGAASAALLICGLVVSTFFAGPIRKVFQAKSWQHVPCTILSSQTRSPDGGETCSVEVTYEYFVGGERRLGSQYQFMSGSSSIDCEGKRTVVGRLAPGTQAVCFVNPADPSDAVIERGFTPEMLFALIPAAFVAFGCAGILGVLLLKGKTPLSQAAQGSRNDR